jgi:hypothetical protein
MAKISALPQKAVPNGNETVVILDNGVTKQAPIGPLVAGATSPEVAAVGADLAQTDSRIRAVAANQEDIARVADNMPAVQAAPGAAERAEAAAALAGGLVGAITLQTPRGYAGGFADAYGRYSVVIQIDGGWRFAKASFNDLTAPKAAIGGSGYRAGAPAGYSQAWGDALGRYTVGIKTTGELAARRIVGVASINGKPWSEIAVGGSSSAPLPRPILDAEINMWTIYGQSYDCGTESTPALTTVAQYDGLRFNDGVRLYDANPITRTSFVPLIETTNGNLGETVACGMEASIKQGLIGKYGIAPADRRYQMLMTCEATGGTPSAGLAVGTAQYNRIKEDISAANALARAQNASFKYRGFSWFNGASDYINGVSAASHISNLTGIRNGLDAHAKSVNPSNGDVLCFMSQVYDHATYGSAGDPRLALAQLELSRTDPRFILMGIFNQVPVSGYPHTTNRGSQWRACYYGRVYQRVVIERGVWKPLAPVDAYRSGKVVMVRFEPESGRIMFDTAMFGDAGNKGFSLVDANGAAIAIASIDIVGRDTVKIVAAAEVPANARVRTGFADGGGTNLRDTMGDTEKRTVAGITYALHNLCVISETTLI